MSARTGNPRKILVPKLTWQYQQMKSHKAMLAETRFLSVASWAWPLSGVGAGSSHCGKSSKHLRNFRVGTLNLNTLKGRLCEMVETLFRRKVDPCCVQETRYRSSHSCIIKGKDWRYKLETAKVQLVLECLLRRRG